MTGLAIAGTLLVLEPSTSQAPQNNRGVEILLQESGEGCPCIEALRLDDATLKKLAARRLSTESWQRILSIHVASGRNATENPPMLGSYRIVDSAIRFTPRFRFEPGIRYLAVFLSGALASLFEDRPRIDHRRGHTQTKIEKSFAIPKSEVGPTTVVENIYPTRTSVPENLLKFYLHFSAPMRRGDAYRSIRLVDNSGREVDLPFLELDEELWDASGKRFTLFFDPGRIKRGLKPREEVGPALEEGKSYTLAIDRAWKDAAGNPMKHEYRKRLVVGPPDETQPRPEAWKVHSPSSGNLEPLVVEFPEALDHAMLLRVITILDPNGKAVRGQIAIESEETRWIFTPARPWEAGTFQLSIESTLEDLAGNSIARPFEVDVFRPIETRVVSEFVRIPFHVK